MNGAWYGLDKASGDRMRLRRTAMGLTKNKLASRMFEWLASEGVEDGEGKQVTFFTDHYGFGAWVTQRSCRHAIDDLEGDRRWLKERAYVDAVHAVLGAQVITCEECEVTQ